MKTMLDLLLSEIEEVLDKESLSKDDLTHVENFIKSVPNNEPKKDELNNKFYKYQIKLASELIKKSNYTMVLTGAGMSTESGIPDFRSKKGFYSKYPENLLSHSFFYKDPDTFYKGFMDKFKYMLDSKPNIGHNILAKWEANKIIQEIATQNIDGLHQVAGSKFVTEVHGSIKTFTLQDKRNPIKFNLEDLLTENKEINYYYNNIKSPKNLIKPDVVLFEENVIGLNPILKRARDKTELIIILGTSLKVQPFASIPKEIKRETPIIIINYDSTDLDYDRNVIKISKGIGDTLVDINKLL